MVILTITVRITISVFFLSRLRETKQVEKKKDRKDKKLRLLLPSTFDDLGLYINAVKERMKIPHATL